MYQEMAEDTDYYFKNKKVVNFDILNYGCRGDRLEKTYKENNTVEIENFNNYPVKEKDTALSLIFRTKGDDLWVTPDLMIKHFKKN